MMHNNNYYQYNSKYHNDKQSQPRLKQNKVYTLNEDKYNNKVENGEFVELLTSPRYHE